MRKRSIKWMGMYALLLVMACFSTTPPDVQDPPSGGGGSRSNWTAVTGLVLLRRGPGDFVVGKNHRVQVIWRIASGGGGGPGTLIKEKIVMASNSGVYTDSILTNNVALVEARPRLCTDPAECCTVIPPCPACVIWGTWRRTPVVPKARVQLDVSVSCGQ